MRQPPERDEEFVAFVAATSQRLLHVAWLVCGDRHRAEDLVQTALAGTYRHWGRVRQQDAYAYARRAVLNANISWWRRLARERFVEPPELPGPDEAERSDVRESLRASLLALTARERAVVVLRYLEDLSEEQTAAELDIARGTVKSTASRALAKLRADAGAAALAEGR
ncbi:RNA polymerase sigma-70 factor (sigma-E family) [Motilibacter rhizosphaerae]|uniref:RNA polymerase sigma-70 factor (Sigma-E family) n=1 Tax=Motilibacter rhizosphaerae TaxID=598652 RepID=A0A4Q7NB25_9ACTN|nr:SigE family RNA polymerase sigma factor [Motilibacter rhizosphaerae]RZS79379.1 RNA polymerase sigma-70 factor (sigma-E family) [Motilibacter rhizosphaerae]